MIRNYGHNGGIADDDDANDDNCRASAPLEICTLGDYTVASLRCILFVMASDNDTGPSYFPLPTAPTVDTRPVYIWAEMDNYH